MASMDYALPPHTPHTHTNLNSAPQAPTLTQPPRLSRSPTSSMASMDYAPTPTDTHTHTHFQLLYQPLTQPPRLLCPWNFPGKNSGMGYRFLLQRIFLTQGSDPCLLHFLHWQLDSFPVRHSGSPMRSGESH